MSLADALDQAINKPSSITPPEKPEIKALVEEDPIEEAEEEQEEMDEEVDEEVEEASSDEEEPDEEEEALQSKFKQVTKSKEVKDLPRVEKIIEDGVEREIPISDLIKGYQKASVSGKRFEEASAMKKEAMLLQNEVNDFVEFFDQNPIAAGYEVLGQEKMDAFLNQYRREMDSFDAMSDIEKENFILRKNQQMGEIRRGFKNGKQMEGMNEQEAQAIKESLSVKVEKVIQDAGFKTSEMKIRLLNKMKSYARTKPSGSALDESEIEMLADRVKSETKSEFQQEVSAMTDDQLLEFLGTEVVEKVRKQLVAKFKTKKAEKVEPTKKAEPKKTVNSGPKNMQDYQDFWKNPS